MKLSQIIHLALSVFLLACLGAPASLSALTVTGLYTYEIAVENQSDQERSRAFREALAAVIVKVTGEDRWLENPSIDRALENAENYVEAIASRTETRLVMPDDLAPGSTVGPLLPTSVEQELLNVSFARGLIDELLAQAAIPVWDSNRPSVLVWMALQNDAGERSLLSEESNPGIIRLMQQYAQQRGLPIIFPVLDFEDRRNVSADQVWALDEQAVAVASTRYAPDSILAGRLLFSASGDLVGMWQFQFQDQVQVFDSLDTELASYISEPLNRITNDLARHFAITQTGSSRDMARLRIEGIAGLAAYAELVNFLEELVLVDTVTVASLQGEVLELNVSLQGSQEQLYESLSLVRNLSLLDQSGMENRPVLTYRWMR